MLFYFLSGWDSEIDIQMTVHLVRSQRSTMVRTEVRVMRNCMPCSHRFYKCIELGLVVGDAFLHVALLHCKKGFFSANVGYLSFLPLVNEGKSHSDFSRCVTGDYLANLPSGIMVIFLFMIPSNITS